MCDKKESAPSPPASPSSEASKITAFHSWEVTWDSKGTSAVNKLTHLAASPTKLFKNKRLVAVEVRRSSSKGGGKDDAAAEDEEVIRVMTRAKKNGHHDEDVDDDASVVGDAFSPSHDHFGAGGWTAGRVPGFATPESKGGGSSITPRPADWTTRSEIPLRDVNVIKHQGKKVQVGVRGTNQVKDVRFGTDAEGEAFFELVELIKKRQRSRDEKRFKDTLGSLKVDAGDEVKLLIEVVSCWGLPAADALGLSDPYVKVTMEGKEVHKTKYKSETCDPVYTVKDNSLFVLSTNVKELFECREGLAFEVKDYDALGANDTLCQVKVPPRTLFEAKGERMVYKLLPPSGKKVSKSKTAVLGTLASGVATGVTTVASTAATGVTTVASTAASGATTVASTAASVTTAVVPLSSSKKADDVPSGDEAKAESKAEAKAEVEEVDLGHIAIRCRHATEPDLEFMRKIRNGFKALEEKSPTALATEGGRSDLKSLLTTNTKKSKSTDDPSLDKIKKYKVRPGPDPSRKEETKWMTDAEIQKEAMKKSHHWLDCGTGDLGRIYLEVIGCDNLPNLDSGGMMGNKTDSFVNIVHEDVVVRTDVIADKLSPRWMPWTKRAFMFRMMHSSSQVFLGVFDHDTGLDDHDIVGRVAVDLSTFRPATEYVLHYDIFDTDKISKRTPRGSITIRLMIEIPDERALILSALHYTPTYHVNLRANRDFLAVRYTATGQYGAERYGMAQINEYIEELMTYKQVLYHMREGLLNVILWRGKLPLKSLFTFLAFVILVEYPNLLPAFFMAGIAAVLTSVLDFRRSAPSPWVRARPFISFLKMLLFGKYSSNPQTIQPYENAEEFEAFQKAWLDRLKEYEEEAEKAYEENLKKQEEMQKELQEIGDANVDISTKTKGGIGGTGISIDPLMAIYRPVQDTLSMICVGIRFGRNVVIWEECYLAFLLSLAAYLLAFIFIFVPWGFLIHWTFRIIVWTFLGPWMKLVDVFWDSKIKPYLKNMQEKSEAQRKVAVGEQAMVARTAREDAAKLAALKKLMFGNFISNVPVYKLSRHRDVPRLESEANPIPLESWKKEKAGREYTRVQGQHLVGDMIPQVEDPVDDPVEAETSMEKKSSVRALSLRPKKKSTANKDEKSSEETPLLSSEGGKSTYVNV